MTELKTAARTETGRTRDNNEDVTVSSARLAVVADGMGGLPGGEMAAGIAAGLIETTFTGRSLDELEAAVRAANWAIWDRAAATPGLEAMGTTVCVAGLLDDGRLAVANVGDSRAYLWHHDTLRQLTQDHSVTAELVHRGELDEEDVAHHPHRGWLTRALGVGPEVEVDGATHPIEPGDRLLVCTDGLVNELSDDEIAKVMATEEDLTAAVERLVGLVTSREAPDDVSVVLAEVSA